MTDILPHPLTKDPTAAWQQISQQQRVKKIKIKTPRGAAAANKIRVVCMSDTHSLTDDIKFQIPDGDIFIHAGDFTQCGQKADVIQFNSWIGLLPHKYKIVIAGNHELSFDETCTHPLVNYLKNGENTEQVGMSVLDNATEPVDSALQTQNMRNLLTNCTYIEDELIEILNLRIYGTPWQPEFHKWAFNLSRGQACLDKWNLIPENIDILVTHGPPVGHGDLCRSGLRAGCVDLLTTVQNRVKPKYHVFGHIHEGYGVTTDGNVIYVNASTCDRNYKPNNPPIVFDITPNIEKDAEYTVKRNFDDKPHSCVCL